MSEEASPPVIPAAEPGPLPLIDRVKLFRDIVYVVAICIAGVWAVITFWYNSSYVPAHETPIVTPSLTLTPVGQSDGGVAINAHLVLKNEGKATQAIWGIALHAYTFENRAGGLPDGGWRLHEERAGTRLRAFRDFSDEGQRLVASEVDLMTEAGRNNPIQPHSDFQWDFLFFVDRAAADSVAVTYDVLQPRANIPPKPEWFTLKRLDDDTVQMLSTPACKSDPACDHGHTNGYKRMSLWPPAASVKTP